MNATRTALTAVTLGLCMLIVGCRGESTSPTGNESPLLPPQNVSATQNAYGDVILSWDWNWQPTLRGYNVYRRNVVESSIQTLTTKPIRENYFVDTGVDREMELEYRVTAVSAKGVESAFASSMIQVQTPERGGKERPED